MKDIKIAFIGYGERGKDLVKNVILPQEEKIVAVCDKYPDRAEAAADLVLKTTGERPAVYTDYREAVDDKNVNTVIIATSWDSHVEIAVYSMEAGKVTAMEVGGAYDISDCYLLVDTYEKTKTPFMFLENCCFGKRELMVLNMVKHGLLGEIVHCSGCYAHDLRWEISHGVERRHYRLDNYIKRNCENYPTHELGPISRVLGINHGNRMLTLTSTASKAAGLHEYIKQNKSDDERLMNTEFKQGDIVTTVIKCAGGETVVMTLDTTLPRYYSRGFTVRGTKGMYEETTNSVFLDTEENAGLHFSWQKNGYGNAVKFEEEWLDPIWRKYTSGEIKGSHGGMDWIEFAEFFTAVRNGDPMPIDVYDGVALMCITPLSEVSIAKGGAPVEIPDFTHGKWYKNE